jgi:hypothetical protein
MNPAMEQMMLQLVARRTGVSAEELRSMSRGGAPAIAARLGIDLPPDFGEQADTEADASPAELAAEVRLDALEAQLAELVDRLAECERAYAAAIGFVEHVAGTLGACPSCLGYDGTCPDCRGRGIPGRYRSVEPRTLHRWFKNLSRQFAAPAPTTSAHE